MRLRDRYALLERIGAGGMSEVWRATDEVLGRPVAVKALTTMLVTDPSLREVTWREARAVARLSHPHVAQVYDYGELPLPGGGVAGYLVMELVTGQTLAERLPDAALRWPEAVGVIRQVASALAAAHRVGVVHRDIKPANVMLTDSGVKVLDFGIAAVAGRADTHPGRLAGTPAYAAPERFHTAAPAQPASDIYSLGVLLYESLVGRPPVSVRDWAEAAAAHRGALAPPYPPVAGLPGALGRLCQACLATEPASRPSAEQVVAELAELAGEPAASPAAGAAPGSDGSGSGGSGPAVGGPAATVVERAAPAPAGGAPAGALPAGALPAGAHRYAVGAARPPGRRDESPATVIHTTRAAAGRRRGWLVAAAVTTAGLVLVLAAAALRPGDGDQVTAGPGGATGAPATSAPTGQQATGPPATGPPAAPVDPQAAATELLAGLDRIIADGLATGGVTDDAGEDLRDELADLAEAITERRPGQVRKQAIELREEIDELVADGELDPLTARRLRAQLDPLLR
jgi:serine/threonine-protein kinase